MHSGELGDAHNPRDAILLGAERLGHAVKLIDDPVALEYARHQALPVEVNLTSNVRLGVVASIETHPFLKFLRLGLKPSLSTDDEGILDTDINQECTLAIEKTDINYAELKQMGYNSIDTSFAPADLKAKLRGQLEADYSVFEKHWK